MEWLFGFLLGWNLSKDKRADKKSDFIKIDDKNYIINNEFVSYEEDTPLLRYKQTQEDNKHWHNYERQRLRILRDSLYGDWEKTIGYIRDHKELLDENYDSEIIANKDKYNKYSSKVDKQEFIPKLTEVEFAIKEKYPHHCFDWGMGINIFNPAGYGYMIHNKANAKYADGNMREMMSKEFENKYY